MAVAPILQLDGVHLRAADGVGPADTSPELSLAVFAGELHLVHWRSSHRLAAALMGHPGVGELAGRLILGGDDITSWPTDVRAKAGMFLLSDSPPALPGVPVGDVLRQALAARRGVDVTMTELRDLIGRLTGPLGVDRSFLDRRPDDDSPTGRIDRLRAELLQLAALEPDLVIVDISTAADARDLELITAGIGAVRSDRPQMGVVVIDHRPAVDGWHATAVHPTHIHHTDQPDGGPR